MHRRFLSSLLLFTFNVQERMRKAYISGMRHICNLEVQLCTYIFAIPGLFEIKVERKKLARVMTFHTFPGRRRTKSFFLCLPHSAHPLKPNGRCNLYKQLYIHQKKCSQLPLRRFHIEEEHSVANFYL